jgi:hypothetical protein
LNALVAINNHVPTTAFVWLLTAAAIGATATEVGLAWTVRKTWQCNNREKLELCA